MDPLNSLGQNSGVGSLSLLQGIFPAQGLNPGLPHCRRILYQLSHKGSPNKTKPFSKRTGHLFGATVLLNIFSSGPVDFKIQSVALSYTNNNSSYTYPALTNYNSYNSGDRLFPLNKQNKTRPNCGLLRLVKLPKVRHLTKGPGRIQHSDSKTQVSPVKEKLLDWWKFGQEWKETDVTKITLKISSLRTGAGAQQKIMGYIERGTIC